MDVVDTLRNQIRRSPRVRAMLGHHLPSLLLVLVVAAGCTGQRPSHRSSQPPSSTQTSATAAGFGTRHATLTCADAVSARAIDAGGLKDGEIAVSALGAPLKSVPLAEDAGLRLPSGLHWYFRKGPIAVTADAADVTITISGPAQALAWAPAAVWTGSVDIGPWAASSLTLRSCPDRDILFLGGILAARPDTCLLVRVQYAGGDERTVRQRLDGAACAS